MWTPSGLSTSPSLPHPALVHAGAATLDGFVVIPLLAAFEVFSWSQSELRKHRIEAVWLLGARSIVMLL